MENKEIIELTIKNMKSIFRDTGEIIQIIETDLKNHDFQPFGIDAACIWGVSRSLKEPGSWLYTYFARAYSREKNLKRAIGFCIHLGGYPAPAVKKLDAMGVKFPFLNVSLLEQKTDFKCKDAAERIETWDWLWGAGWEHAENAHRQIEKNIKTELYDDDAKNITYFIDMLSLRKKEDIHKMVVEPLLGMYEGNENWVSKNEIQVIQLPNYNET